MTDSEKKLHGAPVGWWMPEGKAFAKATLVLYCLEHATCHDLVLSNEAYIALVAKHEFKPCAWFDPGVNVFSSQIIVRK